MEKSYQIYAKKLKAKKQKKSRPSFRVLQQPHKDYFLATPPCGFMEKL